MRIGVDLVEVWRIRRLLEDYGEHFLRRLFTEGEVEYSLSAPPPLREQRLAARFAAKEAFMKALGKKVPYREIEVLRSPNGAPALCWKGKTYPLSLSHTENYALALVVIV